MSEKVPISDIYEISDRCPSRRTADTPPPPPPPPPPPVPTFLRDGHLSDDFHLVDVRYWHFFGHLRDAPPEGFSDIYEMLLLRDFLFLTVFHSFSPFSTVSHYFSPFLTVFHRFSLFFTVFHRFSTFSTIFHCCSLFLSVSHCFSLLFTTFHRFSPFLFVGQCVVGPVGLVGPWVRCALGSSMKEENPHSLLCLFCCRFLQ